MPKWGLSMKTGKIVEWLVAEGDTIAKGDDVVDIETDKIAGHAGVAGGGAAAADRRRARATSCRSARCWPSWRPPRCPTPRSRRWSRRPRPRSSPASWRAATSRQPQLVEVGGRTISYLTLAPEDADRRSGGARARLRRRQELVAVRAGAAGRGRTGARARPARARRVDQGRRRRVADTLADTSSGSSTPSGSSGPTWSGTRSAGRSSRPWRGGAGEGGVADAARPGGLRRRGRRRVPARVRRGASRRELKPLLGRLFADESLVTRQLVDDLLRYKRLDGVDKALSACSARCSTATGRRSTRRRCWRASTCR